MNNLHIFKVRVTFEQYCLLFWTFSGQLGYGSLLHIKNKTNYSQIGVINPLTITISIIQKPINGLMVINGLKEIMLYDANIC